MWWTRWCNSASSATTFAREGRVRPLRGFQTLTGARVLCAGHALVRTLIGSFHQRGVALADAPGPRPPLLIRAWDELAATLLVG